MRECIYRIPVDKKYGGLDEAVSKASGMGVAGLTRKFNNGLCEFLTARDIGPVECSQPEHSEKDCPDISSK